MQVMAKNEFTEEIYIQINVSSSLAPPGPFNLQLFFFQCDVVTSDMITCWQQAWIPPKQSRALGVIEVLVIWVPLHCCAERGSPASRVWTQRDAIHITTSSRIWSSRTWSMESSAHKYLDFSLDLVSPLRLFCSVWGGQGVLSTSGYNSAAARQSLGLPGLTMPSSYQPAGSPR